MLDTVQYVLIFVVVGLAILLLVLGIQVFFILKDLRKTVTKANKVLDHANQITEDVSAPIAAISGIANTLKAGSLLTVLKMVRGVIAKDDEDERPRHHA